MIFDRDNLSAIRQHKGYNLFFLILLICIIVSAFTIRYQGSRYELPDLVYSDEAVLLLPVEEFFATGLFNPPQLKYNLELFYGPFYSNLVIFIEIIVFFLLKLIYGYNTIPVWLLYFVARLINVVLACLSLFLLYRLGKLVYDKVTALVAVAFVAFNVTHLASSVYAKSDMLMSALVLIDLFFIYRILETRLAKYYVLTGVFTGLAIASKLNAIAIFWPIAVVFFSVQVKEEKSKNIILNYIKNIFRVFCDKKLYLFLLFIFIGFILVSPYSLLKLNGFLKGVYDVYISKDAAYFMDKLANKNVGFTLDYLKTIYAGYLQVFGSIYLFWFFMLGLIHSLFSSKKKLFVLFVFNIGSFMLLRKSLYNAHHYLVVLPILFLVTASGINFFIGTIFFVLNNKYRSILTLLSAAIIFYSLHLTMPFSEYSYVNYLNRLLGKNAKYSKNDVLRWIYSNIPIGSKIALADDFGSFKKFISQDLYSLEEQTGDIKELYRKDIEYVIISKATFPRKQYTELYDFLDKQILLKEFSSAELLARFRYGFYVYQIKKDKNINSFKLGLAKYTPADGDFAAIKTIIHGNTGKKYTLKASVFDDYNLTDKTCPIFQRIIINDKVVWDYSVADPRLTTGWNEQVLEFVQGEKPTEIIIGVWAKDKGEGISQRPWGCIANTQVTAIIVDEDGSIPVTWQDISKGGHDTTQLENFYTKTIGRDRLLFLAKESGNGKHIKDFSFEEVQLGNNWAAKVINFRNSNNFFKFKLKTDNPKKGAFAGLEALFCGIPNEKYTLSVYLKDMFPKANEDGKLWQQIFINGEVVYKRDISDEKHGQWDKVVINFLQGEKPTKIEIRTTYLSDVLKYNYGKLSDTIVVLDISSEKGIRVPYVSWKFSGNDLCIIKPEERDKKIFEDYLGLNSFWLDEDSNSQFVVARTEEGIFSDGKRALHLGIFNKQYTLQTGQVLTDFEKNTLEDFSIDYYIDSHQTKGRNAKLKLRFIAKSLGGKLLKEKTYTFYDAKKDYPRENFFNRWHTFSRNIKKDFSHIFMDWNKVAFIEIILEAESDSASSINAYFDNLKG